MHSAPSLTQPTAIVLVSSLETRVRESRVFFVIVVWTDGAQVRVGIGKIGVAYDGLVVERRYLTHDPVRQFASPYTYTNGDPVNLTDPTGAFFGIDDLITLVVGFAVGFSAAAIQAGVNGASFGEAMRAGAIGGAMGGALAVAGLGVVSLAGSVAGAMGGATAGEWAAWATALVPTAAGGYSTAEAFQRGQYVVGSVGAVFTAFGLYGLAQGPKAFAQGANGGGSRGDWEQLLDAELEPAQCSGTEATSASQQGRSVVLTYPDGTTEIRSGGSVSWRTNNPGNLVQGPFARSHGSIGQYRNLGHNIAVFPSEAAGQAALESRLTTPPFSRWTLNRAISVYAPPSVNPTARYQAFVAARLGVSGSTTLGSLSPSQISTLARAIREFEGWTPGRVAVGWGL